MISNPEDRKNYEVLLSKLGVLVQITQSVDDRKRVMISKVKQLGIDAMLHIKHSLLDENGQPWVVITNSVHQLCAHSWELFELNSGSSISKWSEIALEAWNKHVRSFKSGTSSRSRQTYIRANLHDIFRRMLITSHPAISSKRYRPLCRICVRYGQWAFSKECYT